MVKSLSLSDRAAQLDGQRGTPRGRAAASCFCMPHFMESWWVKEAGHDFGKVGWAVGTEASCSSAASKAAVVLL